MRWTCTLLVVALASTCPQDSLASDTDSRKVIVEPGKYVDSIVAELDKKVKNYGVESFPLHDIELAFNQTYQDHTFEGNVTLYFGYVMSVQTLKSFQRFLQYGVNDTHAYITADVNMPNITIMYNVESKLTKGENFMNTVEDVFPENRWTFAIHQKLSDESVTATYMFPSSCSAPVQDYGTVSDEVKILFKLIKLRQPAELYKDLAIWADNTLKPFLNDIVQTIAFPIQESE